MKIQIVNWAPWWMLTAILFSSANAKKPNVVFIIVDDMGWNDVSFHGSDQIQTPNIDAMAYTGMILQQYYSEAICTPARTALLTGKYPMRLGMHGAPLYNGEDRGIPVTEKLLPTYMKELGYATHLVGKWHVGMSRPEYLPTVRGYDTHYGMRGGYNDYYMYHEVEIWPNGREVFGLDLFDEDIPQEEEQRYIVDALTDRAVETIHNHNASQPFFLHLAHNAPHVGNDGGKLQPPLNSEVKNGHIAYTNRRLLAEVIRHLDISVGRVVKALAEKGILDDTIIVFASDNGAPTIGQYNNWGVNWPLRGIKFSPWEGGVRVPAFIWHSSFKPGVWNGLMHITDWLPTLTAAVGGQLSAEIDGVNQWDSILQNSESQRSEVLLSLIDNDLIKYASYRAGDYKIIVGNVTGVMNDYYGERNLRNKYAPPAYYPALQSCEVAGLLKKMGKRLDYDKVSSIRAATALIQEDTTKDPTLCIPSPTRGCLYNIRRDPSESHDLWDGADNITDTMIDRLNSLWAMQIRRGPTILPVEGDPENFNFVWTPFIFSNNDVNVQCNHRKCNVQ